MLNEILECHMTRAHALRMRSLPLYILAANPHVACDNYFYGGFINFFFLQFKLI